jgi:hypothetical protein
MVRLSLCVGDCEILQGSRTLGALATADALKNAAPNLHDLKVL